MYEAAIWVAAAVALAFYAGRREGYAAGYWAGRAKALDEWNDDLRTWDDEDDEDDDEGEEWKRGPRVPEASVN